MEQNFWSRGSICPLCNGEMHDPISKPCGHSFCLNCLFKYQTLRGGRCPSCINEPLQLISVDENGLLVLNENVLTKCFLRGGNEECPVFLISVIGERRTGKSFLMNYIMKALHIQEETREFGLGAEAETLKGFNWKPGPDTVTNGIWIWSKPFILEQRGQKIAVFLMDMEGSMDIEVERKSNIKMCMLTMLLSSHLVYNVNSNIKETDIDYLEIYCHGLGSDRLHKLKYFDFLIRNWYDAENCGAEHGESYFKSIIEKTKTRYKNCTFLEVLNQCSSSCFLMPHPGNNITSRDTGRFIDMNTEFKDSLRNYLSDVVKRVLSSIGSADSENTLTCSDMAQKMLMEFFPYINEMKHNISSPSEPMWKLKIGTQVADKILELNKKFETSSSPINAEDRNEQLEKLKTYLETEGNKFCKSHNVTLCLHGITAAAGVAAVPLAGAFAAAPAAVGTFQAIGAWFGYQAAAPVAASALSTTSVIGGVTAAAEVGVAYVRKWMQ
ncbi:RING finger protein 112-like isoform X2 [Phyllobates terribilis]|uniref:RING finger protein 112-like isoform X2 n=1 Tax=Phyllobates terribilis TaxID=111132 RepID=UPI003CCAEA74